MSDSEFAGQRAVVTGATRGIGAAVARRLASGGAVVTVTGRTRVEEEDPEIRLVQVDSSTPEGATELAEAVLAEGPVDILVDAVGGSASRGGVRDLVEDDWTAALQANLLAAVRLDRLIFPSMVARGSGCIVHITSIQRRLPMPWSLPYAAAKAALATYSTGLARDLADSGVRVNAVAPGLIETPAVRSRVLRRAGRRGSTRRLPGFRSPPISAESPWDASAGPKRSRNSSPSWPRLAPDGSPAPNT